MPHEILTKPFSS